MTRNPKCGFMALALVVGLSASLVAQDPTLANLPMGLSTATEETLEPTQARRPPQKKPPAAKPETGKKAQQYSAHVTMESWRSEMDVSGSPFSFGASVLHSTTMFIGDYKNYSSQGMIWGGHLGFGWENVAVDIDSGGDGVMDGGFIFELGGDFRYLLGESPWDVGGDLLFRLGDHGGDIIDYEYTNIRLTIEGGYKMSERFRPYLKFRLNNMYEGEASAAGASFDTEIDSAFGISLGSDFEMNEFMGSFELMLLDVDDFGFVASLGWKF